MWIIVKKTELKNEVSDALKVYCEETPTTYEECTLQVEIEGITYIKADLRDSNGNRRYPPTEIEQNLMIEAFPGETLTDSELNDIILNSSGGGQ